MRCYSVVLASMLAYGSFSFAQQPQAQQAEPPLDRNNPLDNLLLRWEEAMTKVQSLQADVVRETDNKVFKTQEVFAGKALYLKPNLAVLHLERKGNPQQFERYVCTGAHIWEYNAPNKELRLHELPPPKAGQVAEDNFLSFLFGMKAQEAKRRYTLKIAGEDTHYHYVEVVPKFDIDRADFSLARLALTKSTFLPRLLVFTEPNGNLIKWELPEIQIGAQIDRNVFAQPPTPEGWRLVRVPKNQAPGAQAPPAQGQAPRVARPNQP